MDKKELVEIVEVVTRISKKDSIKAVDAVFSGIINSLKQDRSVNIKGFGVFSILLNKPRQGRNPRTGEFIHIGSSRRVKFKASSLLKDLFNK